MNKKAVQKIFSFFLIVQIISCAPKSISSSSKGEKIGETTEVKDKNIEWESYSSESLAEKNAIKSEHLQGQWNAFKGIYRFDQHINAMNLTVPFIIEFKNEDFRRSVKSSFEKYTLVNNLIISAKSDTGIINKITPTELTISWKDKNNYTRYFYKK